MTFLGADQRADRRVQRRRRPLLDRGRRTDRGQALTVRTLGRHHRRPAEDLEGAVDRRRQEIFQRGGRVDRQGGLGELHQPVGQRLGALPGRVVAQHGLGGRDQFVRFDRLDQVGVGASVEALGAVDHVDGVRRDVDHREGAVRGIAFDPFADLETAHVGQLDVENHEVDPGAGQHRQRLPAGLRLAHRETGPRKPADQQISLGRAVVDDEDGGGVHDTGNRTVNVLPSPTVDSTRSAPPSNAASLRA